MTNENRPPWSRRHVRSVALGSAESSRNFAQAVKACASVKHGSLGLYAGTDPLTIRAKNDTGRLIHRHSGEGLPSLGRRFRSEWSKVIHLPRVPPTDPWGAGSPTRAQTSRRPIQAVRSVSGKRSAKRGYPGRGGLNGERKGLAQEGDEKL
jgi:hypothetical protein